MSTDDRGLPSAEEIASMTGKQRLQAVIDGRLPEPSTSDTLSFRLVEVGDGFAAFEGEPGTNMLNPLGTVHGGWALAMIDSATGCACHSLLAQGSSYTTIETKANFCKPITPDTGRVRAEGRVISQGKKIISAQALVRSQDGRVLAHGTSTMMVLKPD